MERSGKRPENPCATNDCRFDRIGGERVVWCRECCLTSVLEAIEKALEDSLAEERIKKVERIIQSWVQASEGWR